MSDPITIASRHAVFLERLKTGEFKKFEPFFEQLRDTIAKKLTSADIATLSRGKLEKLLATLNQALLGITTGYTTELAKNLVKIGIYEAGFEARALESMLGTKLGIDVVTPTNKQIRAALEIIPLSIRGSDAGKLLYDMVKEYSFYEADRLTNAIRQGYFEGQTTAEIVRKLTGSPKNGFKDSVIAVSRRDAETITRTSIAHASSVARSETWAENQDILDGYEWVSTLDSKTSQQCRSLDGKVFSIGKGPLPPIHARCRSTTAPKLKDEFSFLSEGATRASKDGYVDANLSYYDWLKKQPKDFQDKALGSTRAKLFQSGGLSAKRFSELNLDRNFMPLSLEEMRKLEPLAFQKAGI